MRRNTGRLKEALRAVAKVMLERKPEHPSADELVRDAEGTLTAEERDRVQDHLAICPACTQLRLALPKLSAGERVPAASTRELEELAFLETAAATARKEEGSPPALPGPGQTSSRSRLYALAAALAVAIGSSLWLNSSSRSLNPGINLPTEILSIDPNRADRSSLPSVDASDGVLVVLSLPATRGDTAYRIVLSQRDGDASWSSPPTLPTHGEITLDFVAGALERGVYDFEVLEPVGEGERLLGSASIRVE